ncbi:ABC transporter permease [Actinoplanes oblitus]|uniref:ABC transporter permease n=1 Tax=Actinoplanes oblitus TaxID=3040509 RepID=A0ABY8WT17_9ACTN|nr:FtsX-like permease family protein [Actinoplanes oblitus]WIM98940.1 ABC transporter permease [Actinoplanes oblitus]
MALILRRAAAARGLLAAAAAVMLAAVLLLTGLTAYATASAGAGLRAAVQAADPDERSVLVRGALGTDPQARDAKVRQAYAPARVNSARYGSGWAVRGATGTAVPDADGIVYASLVQLDDLHEHADLVSGSWPAGNGDVAVAQPAATALGLHSGATLRLLDRNTKRTVARRVSGVWRPRDSADPYWLLTPDLFAGHLPQTATYGPIVAADPGFFTGASGGWLIRPALDSPTLASVRRAVEHAEATGTTLPETTGLGTSATVSTGLPVLADRLVRADLVRRSTLVTPLLLVVVLGGYALSLVAVLLAESRRGETALLRARGASRRQLAGLAALEASGLVLPGVLAGPPLAVALVRPQAPDARLDAGVWLVAALVGLGGVLALSLPAMRRGGTYVAETAGRKRLSTVRRAGLDLVVVALAVLGWLQLRQYSAPTGAGGLGIDPLLAAAPTLGVLTGAVLAVRLLPPVARFAAGRLNRGRARSALFGTWQAGRRAHAGPMVMVALAVAAATVSWCLAATAQQSRVDQAVQQTGADLRLVETGGAAPAGRAGELAALPGVRAVVPAWRDFVPLTAGEEPAELIALDAAAGRDVVQARDDALGGPPAELLGKLAAAGGPGQAGTLRPGRISSSAPLHTIAILTGGRRVDLGFTDRGRPRSFTAAGPGLLGFKVEGTGRWRITSQEGTWRATDQAGSLVDPVDGAYQVTGGLTVAFQAAWKPVPIAITPAVQAAFGKISFLNIGRAGVPVTVVAVINRMPGTGGGAAILADRAALDARLFGGFGVVHDTNEWWLSGTAPDAAGLSGLRVLDRRQLATTGDAYGTAARIALSGAALGAMLLAVAGIAADARATARHRSVELAVLHTLGAGPRLLARSLIVEQALLAGLGALAGLGVGLLVAAAMAPLLVLTPAAGRPEPAALLQILWGRTLGSAALLVAVALAVSATTALAATRRLPATRLRLGEDR